MMDATGRAATIATAIDHLKAARDLLRRAHASRAADATARALKSADGAKRHAEGQAIREEVKP